MFQQILRYEPPTLFRFLATCLRFIYSTCSRDAARGILHSRGSRLGYPKCDYTRIWIIIFGFFFFFLSPAPPQFCHHRTRPHREKDLDAKKKVLVFLERKWIFNFCEKFLEKRREEEEEGKKKSLPQHVVTSEIRAQLKKLSPLPPSVPPEGVVGVVAYMSLGAFDDDDDDASARGGKQRRSRFYLALSGISSHSPCRSGKVEDSPIRWCRRRCCGLSVK